jgi:hypothetical protein
LTVSCHQADALVRAAESRTGVRPWRRTDLLAERVRGQQTELQEDWRQEVYGKAMSAKVTSALRRRVTGQAAWARAGDNAEMMAWPRLKLDFCPYLKVRSAAGLAIQEEFAVLAANLVQMFFAELNDSTTDCAIVTLDSPCDYVHAVGQPIPDEAVERADRSCTGKKLTPARNAV